MSGSTDINQDVSMNGTLDVQGATTIFGRLSVNDDASFSGDVDANDITAQGRLFVNKELFLYKDVTTSASLECKNLSVNGFFTAAFQDNTIPITAITNSHIMTTEGDLQEGVKVSKDAKLLNRVFVTSDIVGSNDLLLSNDAVLSNRLYVSSDVSLNKTVFIGDDATIAKRLFAAGDVSLNGNTHMEGDVTIVGTLTAGSYADNTIPTSAFIDDVLTGSNFSNDIVGGNRLLVANDASFGKAVTILEDATIEKRLFTTGDVTISGNTVAQKHLNVTGTITAGSYADSTIPRSAIIGGVLQDTFATDVTMNEKLVVQKELTTNTRLFVDEDAHLKKRLFVDADASFSNKVYVANNLTIGGKLTATNYGTGVIPQAAIDGGVGLLDTNFSDDVVAAKRLFVTSDVSFGKTMTVIGDATISSNLYQQGEATFSENVTAEKGLTVNGLLTVGDYGTGTIPPSAIIGGVGLSDPNFTDDVTTTKRLLVASDVSFGKTLTVIEDATIAKRLFQSGEATFSDNVTMEQGLTVNGTLTANYADNTISQSALIGGVGLTDTNFTTDVITSEKLLVAKDASFGKSIIVLEDATIANKLYQQGEATFSENVTAAKNLDVTGTLTVGDYGTGVIPQAAINGGIGLTDTNFTDADVNVDKRLFVKGDASFNKVLIEKDLTLNERLFANKDVTLSNNVIINGTGGATTTISTPLNVTGAIIAEDLSVNGTLTANFPENSIPQEAIIGLGGASGSQFVEDITTTKRLFVDEDVTMNKRLFITNDLSLGGNVFMGSATGKVTVFDLSINDDASVKGDLHVNGNLYANFADGSIPQSALEASEDSSSFTTDLSTTKRAFVDDDMTLSKSLFVANDLSMAGNLIMGGTNSKITVFDLSVNDDASITGDLHVGGALVATFTDESIPQSAIIGGVGSNVFTEDIQGGARAFIDEDVTMKKRLFIANDLSLGGNVFMGNNNSKVTVFDLSVNDDASVTGDLHVGGALVVNFSDESIPQSAIIGGVGSNVFTEDIQGGARAFIDEDVTMKKRLFIANDLSLGGNVFIGSEIGKLSVYDLSINDDASVKRNLHVDGSLTVGTYPDESIPQSAIIGGVGSNVFTEDISANKKMNIDDTVTINKDLIVSTDLSLGGNIFLGSTNSRVDVKDISVNNNLTVAGVLTASYADETIPQSAIIGGVGSNVFTEDISANKKMNIDDTVTMNKNLIVVTDLSLGGSLLMAAGEAKIYDISVNNDLTVAGNIIGNYPAETIPQSAIIGGVGSNVFTTDISANKKMNIDDTVTMNKDLVVVTDLSLGGSLIMTGSQAKIYDISVNNDLTVAGNIIANYPAETIPQSAIIGGVGSNVFTIDISANKRMFIDDTVTMNKDLVIATDLSMGGNLNMAGGEANILDLNVKNDLTVDKNVTIKGLLNVQQYSNQNIINTTTTNYQLIVSEDLSLNGNLSVSQDGEVTNRLFVGDKLAIGNSAPAVSLDLTGKTDAIQLPAGTSSERPFNSSQGYIRYNTVLQQFEGYGAGNTWASLGGVTDIDQDTYISAETSSDNDTLSFFTSGAERMTLDRDGHLTLPGGQNITTSGKITSFSFEGTDMTMTGQTALTTLGVSGNTAVNSITANNITVSGSITVPDASIPASAIVGEVASTSSGSPNFLLDVSMNKRLFVKSDLSMGGDLTVVGDASFNNTLQAQDLVVTGTTTFAAASIKAEAIDGNVGVDFTNDISMNKRLFVMSDVSMGGRLDVVGDASFNNALQAKDLIVTGTTSFPDASIPSAAIIGGGGGSADFSLDVSMNKRLFVLSDVSMGGRLDVIGDASFNGDLNVAGAIKSTGNIVANVTGNVSGTAATVTENTQNAITTLPSLTSIGAAGATLLAEGNLQASNLLASSSAQINGMISVAGDIDVNSGKFSVSAVNGNTTVAGLLNITGTGISNSGAMTVQGNADLQGSLELTGIATLHNATTVGGTLGVTGATTLSDTATVGGTLGVTGVTTLSDAATVGGTLGVTGVTTLSDAATVGGTLGVGGNLTVDTNKFEVVAASGNTSVGGTLSVTSDLAVNGTNFTVAGATGNTSIAGTLAVTGATTMSDNATVGGTLGVTGVTTLSDAATVGGTLGVTGVTTLSDAATVGGTLTVTGATTLNDNVSVADAKTFTVGSGASSLGGSLTVAGATTLNDNVSIAAGKTFTVGTGASSLGGTLTVDGQTDINNDFFIKSGATNKISMTQSSGNIFADGYVWSASQIICGNNDKFSVLGTNGNTEIGGNLNINTDKFVVTAASGNTDIAGTLDVTGDTKINTDKFVVTAASGNTAIAGTLDVDGNAVLKSDLSLNQQLFVGQNAVFDKDVTIEGNLSVQQYQSENIINTTTTNYQLIVSEDLSLNGRLFADYDASFGANIFVENKSILHNDVSMNSRLFVFGDSSFNNNVFVRGALDVSGAISMDGDVSLNNSLFTANDISVNGINIGRGAGNSDTNTVVGKDALITNSTGTKNTAFGIDSLKFNTTGISNTAGGQKSLFNNAQGSYNTAFGTEALLDTTAGYNTGIGYQALKSNTTGTNNTAIGNAAGLNSQQGTSNTFVGYGADIDTNATGTIDFSTAVGYNAKATESNQIMIGGDATNGRIFLNANDISGNAGTLDVKLINFTAESIPANAVEGSSSETTSLTGRVIMNADLRVDGSANLQHDVTIGQRAWLQDRLYVGGRVDVVNDASFNSNVQMANINGMVSFVTTGNIEIAGAISQGTALNATEYTNYIAKTVSPAFATDVVRTSTNGQYVAIYDDATGNQMYMSKDYGATFTTVSLGTTGTGVTDSTYDINRRVSMDETGQYIVLVGNSNVCWSNNYGVSFSTSLSDSTLTYTCASTNGQYLAVGTNNEKLYISTDYGATLPAHAQGPVNIEGDDGSGGSGEKHNWRHVVVNSTGKYISCVTDTKIYGYANAAAAYGSSSAFTNNTTNSTLTAGEITALQTLHMTRDGNYIFTSIDGAVYRAPTGSITNGSWKNTTVQSTSGAYWNISTTTTSGMDGRFLYLVDKNNAGKVLASNDYGTTIADDPQSSDASRDYQNITVTGNGAYTYANTATGLFVKEYKDGTTASIITGEAFILSQDASFNNRIFVDHDVSFNKRLFVGENSILNGDVSMNSKMNIEGDLSMNSRLFVKKSANANVFMESYQTGITEMDVRVVSKTAEHRFYNNGSSSGYLINEGESPYLTFVPGKSYRFLQSDSTNSTHQIKFYLSPDKTTLYENGVTYNGTAGSAGAYTQIDVSMGTPSVLYYQCVNHGLMGNQINVLGSKSFDGDLSYNVIKLPSGTTSQRPASIERGVVRYNTTTDQFEGYGAGNAWGSLGGVIDVDQDTYIKAETAANDDNDQLQFFTAGTQRMIIGNNGDISMNHDLKLNSDSGKITLGLDDDVIMKHDGTDGLDIDSAGALSLNSSAGAINLGNDAVTGAINIGSGASARTITVGNDASTKVDVNALAIELDAGTGGLTLESESTSANAILVQASSGGIMLRAADEARIKLSNANGDSYFVMEPSATAANEKFDMYNAQGTAADAIRIKALNGGLTFDAGTSIALTSTDALTLTDGTATLSLGGTGATSITGAASINLASTGAVRLNSSGGAINIGEDTDTGAINIGSGASARTITVGNNSSTLLGLNAATIDLNAGAGGVDIDSAGAVAIDTSSTFDVNATGALSLNSSGGAINVGDDAATGAINIGSGASARTITVGNDASTKVDVNATAIELDAGTGGLLLNSASTSAAGIDIAASAGGVRMSVADGSRLRLANAAGDTRFQIQPNATAALEKVEVINTSGTATDALKLEATAGGLDFNAGSTIALTAAGELSLDSTDTTNGIKVGTSTSGVPITIGHTTSEVTVADNLTVTGTTTMTGALDANSTADIADTLTLSKASGTGLSVTSDATVGGNLVVTGNMTVNGTTTTISTTNTTVSDSLMELSSGTSGTPANDAGLIIERGSSDNAFIGWDESADKFIVGTTTATGGDTGDLTVTAGTLVANLDGTVNTATQNSITTMTGLVSVGTSGTDTEFAGRVVANDLSMGGAITLGGHIIPNSNADYDLGNAEYKIRHLFLSDNSIWLGDKHKIDVSGGRIKFKEANLAKVPMTIKIAYDNSESAAQTAAEAATSPGRNKAISAFTLNDWLLFSQASGKTINGNTGTDISIDDIFTPHGENFTVDAPGDVGFSDLSFNVGTTLDILGNINVPDNSIPSSAIIGGVGSNNFTTDVSMNQRLFIGGDISMNMGSFIHQF